METQTTHLKGLIESFRESNAARSELNQWFTKHKCVCMPDDFSLQEVVDEVLDSGAEHIIFTHDGFATICLQVSELLMIYAKAV